MVIHIRDSPAKARATLAEQLEVSVHENIDIFDGFFLFFSRTVSRGMISLLAA